MKLYDFTLSGHAHRVRLFLGLLGIGHERVSVDLPSGQNRSPDFLALNPFGQIPVLEDDGVVIPDSNAILVYLAKKHRRTDWLPEGPAEAARIQRWLSVAAGQIAFGPAAARVAKLFGQPLNPADAVKRAHAILKLVDQTLADSPWIADVKPTIADVALYSYIARAEEGDVDLGPYPRVGLWLRQVESLPGFVPFPRAAELAAAE